MKRHFLTGLKALAVSALAFAAVSCYDDSELWGELEGLEQRVAALEQKLNTEVATLNGLISTLDGKVKDLTAADENLLAKLTALNTQVEGAAKDAKAALAAVNELAGKLDAADGKIDGVIADLEEALEELDAADGALDGKIEALAGDLKGISTDLAAAVAKIAVVKVEKNTAGNYVLTFADGSTLEVSAADANANNTGLVTVVDGKWAIVGADGKTTVLDANVHPDTQLEFKVSDTYEVLVSYDGTTWEQTGVFVKDAETLNVVTGFKDGKDYVTITVGGVEYKLPKISTNKFDIVSGMVFFAEGETKSVPVTMEGVVSSMVAKAPVGWTANLTDLGLDVTAPGGSADSGYDDDMGVLSLSTKAATETPEDSGIIEMWVVTEDGKTLVGNLYVSLGEAFADVSVDADYKVTVTSGYDFYEDGPYKLFVGACKVEDFDAEALSAEMLLAGGPTDVAEGIYSNFVSGDGFQEVVVFDMKALLGEEPVLGTQYVVWAYPYEYAQYQMFDTKECFVKTFVSAANVTYEKTATYFDNAEFTVSVEGAEQFFLGYCSFMDSAELKQMLAYYNETYKFSVLSMLVEGINNGYAVQKYAYGDIFSGKYTGSLRDLYVDDEMEPGTTVSLAILPILPGKSSVDYTVGDVIFKDIKLADFTFDGTSEVKFGTPEVSYNSFEIPVEGTGKRVYYGVLGTDNYNSMKTGMTAGGEMSFAEALMSYGYSNMMFVTEEPRTAIFSETMMMDPIEPETSYTVFGFAVEATGAIGEVYETVVTTTGLPYSANLAVSSIEATIVNGTTSASIEVAGSPVKVYYCQGVTAPAAGKNDAQILDAISPDGWKWKSASLDANNFSDGVINLSIPGVGNNKIWKVAAFVVDADGNFSEVAVSDGIQPVLTTEAALLNYLTDGGIVTLGADITLTAPISIPAKTTVTIDLAGFDLTATSTDVFDVQGTLTINGDENSVVYAGSVTAQTGAVCAVWAHNGGKVTINGGYYKVGPDKDGKRNDCIYAGSNSEESVGTITINGGKFEYVGPKDNRIDYNGDLFLINCADKAPASLVTVNGGTFKNHVPSIEPTGAQEVELGTNKKVYNGETEVTTAHTGSSDAWYTVK